MLLGLGVFIIGAIATVIDPAEHRFIVVMLAGVVILQMNQTLDMVEAMGTLSTGLSKALNNLAEGIRRGD